MGAKSGLGFLPIDGLPSQTGDGHSTQTGGGLPSQTGGGHSTQTVDGQFSGMYAGGKYSVPSGIHS